MDKDKRCLVALSGGVDSTVAAYLLKKQGYHLEGMYLELLDQGFEKRVAHQKEIVKEVGRRLGIRVHYLDKRKEFHRAVVGYFISTYKKGLTPNPCVFCNPTIKFKAGLEFSKKLGLYYFATGHYARILPHPRFGHVLLKGVDSKKDQSYFLHRLNPQWLERILFPLGRQTKQTIRQIAKKTGLSGMVSEESQEVCFIHGDYREIIGKPPQKEGPIILKREGKLMGTHAGIFNYTVGQRRGLGIPGPEPYYVIELDLDKNCVYIGTKEETFRRDFSVQDINWLVPKEYVLGQRIFIKVRSRHKEAPGVITEDQGAIQGYKVICEAPQSAVTPGQAAVFYDEHMVLGGGTICW